MTTLDTIINSVLTKSRGKLVMAIAKAHVLYAWASAKDRIEMVDGGMNSPIL
jgi:hypothetical protein